MIYSIKFVCALMLTLFAIDGSAMSCDRSLGGHLSDIASARRRLDIFAHLAKSVGVTPITTDVDSQLEVYQDRLSRGENLSAEDERQLTDLLAIADGTRAERPIRPARSGLSGKAEMETRNFHPY